MNTRTTKVPRVVLEGECRDCRWFSGAFRYQWNHEGECRRYPTSVKVKARYGCGEFNARPTETGGEDG